MKKLTLFLCVVTALCLENLWIDHRKMESMESTIEGQSRKMMENSPFRGDKIRDSMPDEREESRLVLDTQDNYFSGWKLLNLKENRECGSVLKLSDHKMWETHAYQDMSVPHYFNTKEEAFNWIETNWCKVVVP